jgi:hypothetical protein
MYNNGGLGIDLNDDGVTPNDNNDPDTGANEELNFPVIATAGNHNGTTTITGTIDIDSDPTQATVELFQTAVDPSGYGEGWIYLGPSTPDAGGNWQHVTTMLNIGNFVTATTTDQNLNTSEFCGNVAVVVGISESTYGQPHSTVLLQCYPNPFRDRLNIKLQIPNSESQWFTNHIDLRVYDASGRCIRYFTVPGSYSLIPGVVSWDGKDARGNRVPCGVYFVHARSASSYCSTAVIHE